MKTNRVRKPKYKLGIPLKKRIVRNLRRRLHNAGLITGLY